VLFKDLVTKQHPTTTIAITRNDRSVYTLQVPRYRANTMPYCSLDQIARSGIWVMAHFYQYLWLTQRQSRSSYNPPTSHQSLPGVTTYQKELHFKFIWGYL